MVGGDGGGRRERCRMKIWILEHIQERRRPAEIFLSPSKHIKTSRYSALIKRHLSNTNFYCEKKNLRKIFGDTFGKARSCAASINEFITCADSSWISD
jgi:hypothetical protein